MAWLPPSKRRVNETLKYFDKYDYPLTETELTFWLSPVSPSSVPPLKLRGGRQRGVIFKNGYFFLKNRNNLVRLRRQREKNSLPKWGIAYAAAVKLARIPFVAAIFVTGSLAMNNCKKSDDIDLMIITSPNTLWLTRFIVTLIFWQNRRLPGQKIAPDKICPNLWLDTKNLSMNHEPTNYEQCLYVAHEILQAKCIFDRGGVQYQFLKQNSWVSNYLSTAYKSQILNSKIQINTKLQVSNLKFMIYLVISILNLGFFLVQYLYMKSKMTTERIGPGYAFFHPKG